MSASDRNATAHDSGEPVRLKAELSTTRGIGVTWYADEPPLPPGTTISEGARAAGRTVVVLAAAFALWLYVADEPPLFVFFACVAFPLVAIAVARTFPGMFSVDSVARGPRVKLVFAVQGPFLAMFLRALKHIELLDPLYLVVPALAGGYVIAALCGMRRYSAVVMAFAAANYAIYAAGAIMLANAGLDPSPPATVAASVLSKKKSVFNKGGYFVRVEQAPDLRFKEVEVPFDLYERIRRGDTVCVDVFHGAFALRHYALSAAGQCGGAQPAAR